MNKLTAEVARRDIGHLKSFQSDPKVGLSLSLKEEKYLQALEIALPVLDGRIKSNLLPSEVFNRLYDQYLMGVICGNGNKTAAKDFLEACFVAIYDLVQPTTDTYRQIENDGWIEWGGGEQPSRTIVEIKFRSGRKCKANPDNVYWWHSTPLSESDIIAYRVIGKG